MSAIQLAQMARTNKHLSNKIKCEFGIITNKEYVERLISAGAKPIIFNEYSEKLTIERDEKLRYMRQNYPLGNPFHPDTKKYLVLKAEIESYPKVYVQKYSLRVIGTVPNHAGNFETTWHIVSKTMYDYALTLK